MQIIRIGWYKLNTCKHNLYSLLSRLPSILKDAPKYLFITTKKFKFDLKNVEINIDCYICMMKTELIVFMIDKKEIG